MRLRLEGAGVIIIISQHRILEPVSSSVYMCYSNYEATIHGITCMWLWYISMYCLITLGYIQVWKLEGNENWLFLQKWG